MEQIPQLSDADRATMLKADKASNKLPEPPYQLLDDGTREPSTWLAEWQEANTVLPASNQKSEA